MSLRDLKKVSTAPDSVLPESVRDTYLDKPESAIRELYGDTTMMFVFDTLVRGNVFACVKPLKGNYLYAEFGNCTLFALLPGASPWVYKELVSNFFPSELMPDDVTWVISLGDFGDGGTIYCGGGPGVVGCHLESDELMTEDAQPGFNYLMGWRTSFKEDVPVEQHPSVDDYKAYVDKVIGGGLQITESLDWLLRALVDDRVTIAYRASTGDAGFDAVMVTPKHAEVTVNMVPGIPESIDVNSVIHGYREYKDGTFKTLE